jgi:hypothetical protein
VADEEDTAAYCVGDVGSPAGLISSGEDSTRVQYSTNESTGAEQWDE